MARPKKLSTEKMLRIIDAYYEDCGDPSRLRFSLIEEYAAAIGIDVKAYDFKRDNLVRQRIDELKAITFGQAAEPAITYKSIDVDALLNRNHTTESLKTSLLEIDASWRLVYERAAVLSTKNKTLMVETLSLNKTIKTLAADKEALEARVQALKRDFNTLLLENRYLKNALKNYLYPAIANEILKIEGSLESVDTSVTENAMGALEEPDMPISFSKSIEPDSRKLSREEDILRRMSEKIKGS